MFFKILVSFNSTFFLIKRLSPEKKIVFFPSVYRSLF